MKNIISIGLGLCLAFSACAQTIPSFKSLTATGTTNASLLFPQAPTSQPRLVTAIESSDLATSQLLIFQGTTAHATTAAATPSSTNLVLESTNGLTTSSILYIQAVGTNLVLTNNSLSATGPGFATALPTNVLAGSEVEILTLAQTLGVGANVYKVYGSDGLFVGNYGRALWLVLNGTTYATNYATIHYDATSQ